MYLPTFWKLTTEAMFYRMYHMAGYAVPVGTIGKLIKHISHSKSTYTPILSQFIKLAYLNCLYRSLDSIPFTLQLCFLRSPPSPKR